MQSQTAELRILLERRTAELKDSEERCRTILLNNPDATLIVSRAGQIRLANPAACRLFGRDEDKLTGYEIGLPVAPDRPFEVEIRRPDGAMRVAELRVTPLTWRSEAGYLTSLRDITATREMEERFRSVLVAAHAGLTERERAESLRALAARLQLAREQERALTARDIHEISQVLAALDLHLAAIASQLLQEYNPAIVLCSLEETSRLLCSTVEASARICLQLRPSLVDNLGLAAAIEWHAQEFSSRTGIPVICESLDRRPLDHPDVRIAVFRIFQHILGNVERHAGARKVRVKMVRQRGALLVEVGDDGRGITVDEIASPKSLGIVEMRELTHLFGGDLLIDGAPGQGTTVRLKVPNGARIRGALPDSCQNPSRSGPEPDL